MSDKEQLRKAYIEMVVLKKVNLLQASQQLEVRSRQAKRLYKINVINLKMMQG